GGAQPHLGDRLLARDVDGALAGARERGRRLDQQGRLADARIAADQQRRAADETAAGDAVELGHPGSDARRLMGFAGERLERERPALAGGPPEARPRARRAGRLLDDGVPFSARLALALPAPGDGAAVLAYEGGATTSHVGNRGQVRQEVNCGERA